MNEQNQSVLSRYYKGDTAKRVADMTHAEMKNLMSSVEGTSLWIAILKYVGSRVETAQNGLYSTDPFKSPTMVARYQGSISGLLDLPEAVLLIKEEEKKKADEATAKANGKETDDINDLGGAYGRV